MEKRVKAATELRVGGRQLAVAEGDSQGDGARLWRRSHKSAHVTEVHRHTHTHTHEVHRKQRISWPFYYTAFIGDTLEKDL